MKASHRRNILLFLLGAVIFGVGVGDWRTVLSILGLFILIVVLVLCVEEI